MNSRIELGILLRLFLTDYLPDQRKASPRTVQNYRDALKLLLQFIARIRHCPVAELSIENIDRAAVLAFLDAVEQERHNSVSTRNHRLAAIRSFFRFIAYHTPEHVSHCHRILAIPTKRTEQRTISYLTKEEVSALLGAIDRGTLMGLRDEALVRVLYNTGARIQETLDLRVGDVRLDTPARVRLFGKGRKERICPLWSDTAECVRAWLTERGVQQNESAHVFVNRHQSPLTRFGAEYIVAKYGRLAGEQCPILASKHVHPHLLRHTTAMHLLQAGVDINTIRCWLGHANLVTTNRYVEIDLAMKRAAIESVQRPGSGDPPPPVVDDALLSWLESL